MDESDRSDLREKIIGLGKTSMRKSYYSELLHEKQKLEEQNIQLLQEIKQRSKVEADLQKLNEELEYRIGKRTHELEKLNQELGNSYAELKHAHEYLLQSEKLAALGALVAGISHEVNTPLGICMTSTTFLLQLLKEINVLFSSKTLTSNKFSELLNESIESAEITLNNLIRGVELLDNFKTIAVDQAHYEYREYPLHEYTSKILTNLNPELKKKNVVVEVDCDNALKVYGYPGILTQILSNLVMNSLLHGFNGTGPNSILIRYGIHEETLTLTYQDNGCGMSKKQAKQAFEPFFTTKRGAGGSGLGLFIVYNLVTSRLMGTISLHTEPGAGVRFTIRTPINYRMPIENK